MLELIGKLRCTRLLTFRGVSAVVDAALTTGVNLMALLRVAARLHPGRLAITDERERLSYAHLPRLRTGGTGDGSGAGGGLDRKTLRQ